MDIKLVRTKLGMTQEQFAQSIGTTVATVSRWERLVSKVSPLAKQSVLKLLNKNPCEGCGDDKLGVLLHHWYDKEGKLHLKWLCRSCNSILKSVKGDEVLPTWNEQLKRLKYSQIYQAHMKEIRNRTK